MFSFLKKKNRDKKPSTIWFKWLAILFVVYAFINNSIIHKSDAPVSSVIANILPAQTVTPIANLGGKLLPQLAPRLNAVDTKTAPGTTATCGQEATIAYKATTQDDKPIESGTKTFHIGEGKVMPALELGIIGMAKGGERTITAPSDFAYGIKEFARDDVPETTTAKFNVTLQNLTPSMPEAGAYRILGDTQERGDSYGCSDTAKLNVTLWSIEGKKLSETPVTFTLGKSEVFLGLEQGALGMSKTALRHLVVPPEFQNTLNGNEPTVKFPFPKKQTVLVDIETLP